MSNIDGNRRAGATPSSKFAIVGRNQVEMKRHSAESPRMRAAWMKAGPSPSPSA